MNQHNHMPNINDYLAWRGDLSFDAAPFCEVDNLIFSMLSFIDYDGIVQADPLGMPVKLSDCYAAHRKKHPGGEEFGQIIPDINNDLFRDAAESVRFRDVYVTGYRYELREEEHLQFAAVSFILPDNTVFIAYRGTDDTLVGWHEDFNLSFTCPVMSQRLAVEYLEEIAGVHRGRIMAGGHSKGGNLAVFASVFARPEIRQRILSAYSNDGPGFLPEVTASPEFREMKPKIRTIVPQSSVIGMLLEHNEEFSVVESTLPDSVGLFQHDPFSWSVMGPSFVHLDDLSRQGKRHDEVISRWLSGITKEERRQFTETLFGLLQSTGAKTLTDLTSDQMTKLTAALKSFKELDKDTKDNIYRFVRSLLESTLESAMNVKKRK